MSKRRQLETKFWDDKYVTNLDPSEKLLFLYLLTNPSTNIAGLYEITVRRIAFDTGFDDVVVENILSRLEKSKKIVRIDDWILIVNFIKYQSVNPSVLKGIKRCLFEETPEHILSKLMKIKFVKEKMLPFLKDKNIEIEVVESKEEQEVTQEEEQEEEVEITPAQHMRALIVEEGKGEFTDQFIDHFSDLDAPREELMRHYTEFMVYWTEPTKSGKQTRWEKQNTFEVTRRFARWLKNSKTFNKKDAPKILSV